MSRPLAYLFIAVLVFTAVGQEVKLRSYDHANVTEITLHESRLIPFLYEIQNAQPVVYESILLNLSRIQHPRGHQLEEVVVAEQLIRRLTGAAPSRP
jgi:hypothetical protein